MPVLPILLTTLVAASGLRQDQGPASRGPRPRSTPRRRSAYAQAQVDFGPRAPGTPAHDKAGDWIVAEMKKRTDSVMRAALDADDGQGRRSFRCATFSRDQSVGDAARAVPHALGHAPERRRRSELRQARAVRSPARTTARRASGCSSRSADSLEEDAAVRRRRPAVRRRRGLGRVRRRSARAPIPTRCSARSTSRIICRRRTTSRSTACCST